MPAKTEDDDVHCANTVRDGQGMGDRGSACVWRFFRRTAGGAKQHRAVDGGGDWWEVYPQGESEG